jgi:hypothetical protein
MDKITGEPVTGHVLGVLTEREERLITDCRAAAECAGQHSRKVAYLRDRHIVCGTDWEVIEATFSGHVMSDLGELVRVLDRLRDDA